MSFQVFFSMSTGLSKALSVPVGTYAAITDHVYRVEAILRLERERYRQNPVYWKSPDLVEVKPDISAVTKEIMGLGDDGYRFSLGVAPNPDDVVCSTVEWHNRWVRHLYDDLEKWSETPVADGEPAEELTPEMAQDFWHALALLDAPVQRWTRSYYTARMESLYEVLRGRDSEGVSFDAEPLTERQAAAVIRVFDQHLDRHDLRLDVPNGRDYLASSCDGGYDWCEACGPMHPDDVPSCPKRGECPLIAELCEEDRRDVLGEDQEGDAEREGSGDRTT